MVVTTVTTVAAVVAVVVAVDVTTLAPPLTPYACVGPVRERDGGDWLWGAPGAARAGRRYSMMRA